jgi:hypothetical protein
MIVKIRSARYFDYHVYTEMMKFCQVFSQSCLYRNDEVLPGILTDEVLPGNTWQNFISQNTWQNFIISV